MEAILKASFLQCFVIYNKLISKLLTQKEGRKNRHKVTALTV